MAFTQTRVEVLCTMMKSAAIYETNTEMLSIQLNSCGFG